MVSSTVYLSAEAPRWSPQTEQDVQDAADQGLLGESHFSDIKREIGSTRSGNRELARDLAPFAIDGGTLIVGLEEDKATGAFALVPQPLSGLPERVEQIARTIPDAPIAILTRTIPSNADPSKGYLLVHIPPSGVAPHMVDNKYLGRGDKTKHYLSDAEVTRLHERRRAGEADGITLLRREFERDPIPSSPQAHLFLLAEPSPGRPEMLLDLVDGQPQDVLRRLLDFQGRAYSNDLRAIIGPNAPAPALSSANEFARRSTGAALASFHLTDARNMRTDRQGLNENVVELDVHEDGGLRILMGRLSDHLQSANEQVFFDQHVVVYTRQMIALTVAAAERAGYLGNWILAIGATNLRGKYSYEYARGGWDDKGPRYSTDTYERATTASYAELVNQPGAVATRLVGRFLRALGTTSKFAPMLTDPTP
jgi:hypothetical protein